MAPMSSYIPSAAVLALAFASTVNAQSTTASAPPTANTGVCTTTGAVTPNAPVCPGSNDQSFFSPCGSNYTVTCNSDVDPAGSASNSAAASLSACIAQCDAYAGCRAATFTGSLCYLKTTFTGLTNSGISQALVRYIPPNPAYVAPFAAGSVNASSGCGQTLPAGLVADGASVQYSVVTGDGNIRIYRVHIPKFYDPLKASPLIFGFPGASATALEIERQTNYNDAGLNPYGIAVYVQGVNLGFQSNPNNNNIDDIGFVRSIVANMTSNFCVDTGRIWASGHSNGGGFTNVLACNSITSSLFSVFAMNSGAFYTGVAGPGDPATVTPVDTPVGPCMPSRQNIPIVEVHGTGDTTINYYGQDNRNGRVLPTVPRWTNAWATRQGYSTTNVTTNPATGLTKYVFGNSNNLGIITQYTLSGWTHNWARIADGAQLDSSSTFMNFFYDQTSNQRVVASDSSCSSSSATSLSTSSSIGTSTATTTASTVSSSIPSSISTRTTLTFSASQPGLSCTPCSASSSTLGLFTSTISTASSSIATTSSILTSSSSLAISTLMISSTSSSLPPSASSTSTSSTLSSTASSSISTSSSPSTSMTTLSSSIASPTTPTPTPSSGMPTLPPSIASSTVPTSPVIVPTTTSTPGDITSTSDSAQPTVYPPPPACPTDTATLCAPTDTTTTCSSDSGQAYNVTCGFAFVGTVVQDSDVTSPPPYDNEPFLPPTATPSSGPTKRDLQTEFELFELFERRLPFAVRVLLPDIKTCQAACELSNTTEQPCVAFNYNTVTYNCTIFSEVSGTIQSADIIAAEPVPNPPTAVEYSTYATTTASTSFSIETATADVSTTSSAAPVSTNSASSASCPGSDGQTVIDSCGVQYIIGCGTDTYPGGNVQVEVSFNGCFAACSSGKNGACTGFTWINTTGICYLKNGGSMYFQDPNVNAIGAINVDYYLDAAGPDASAPPATTRACMTVASSISMTSSLMQVTPTGLITSDGTLLTSTTPGAISSTILTSLSGESSPVTGPASSTTPSVVSSIFNTASSLTSVGTTSPETWSSVTPPVSSTSDHSSDGSPSPSFSEIFASSSSTVGQSSIESTSTRSGSSVTSSGLPSSGLSSSTAATSFAPTSTPNSSVNPPITTQSASPTIPPCPTETVDICSSANTQIICSSNNETTYAVTCGIIYTGNEIPDERANTTGLAKRFNTEDFGDCQQACTDTSGCLALNYVDSDCTLFDSVNGTLLAPGAVSAIVVPAAGVVPSYSLVSSQIITSTGNPSLPASYTGPPLTASGTSLSVTTTSSIPDAPSYSAGISSTNVGSSPDGGISSTSGAPSYSGEAPSSTGGISSSMVTSSTPGAPSYSGDSSPSPGIPSSSTLVSSTPGNPSYSGPVSSMSASAASESLTSSASTSNGGFSQSGGLSSVPLGSSITFSGSQSARPSTPSGESTSSSPATSITIPSGSSSITPPINPSGTTDVIIFPTASSRTSTTSSTPSSTAPLCPASNGQNYTTTQGVSYSIACDTALTGNTYYSPNQPRQLIIPTPENCIISCNTDPTCLGINIAPQGCIYFSSLTGSIPAIGTTALEKITLSPIPSGTGPLTITVSVCRASTTATRTITAFTTVSIANCEVGSVCPAKREV